MDNNTDILDYTYKSNCSAFNLIEKDVAAVRKEFEAGKVKTGSLVCALNYENVSGVLKVYSCFI